MPEYGSDTILIPLSPSASYFLHRRNIPQKSLLSYGGGEDIYHTGLDNFRRLENLSQVLDPELRKLHGIPSLEPARYSLFQLKILLDVLYTSIAIIQRIIHEEQPDAISIPVKRIPEKETRRYAFSNEESVYSTILSMEGWKVPVTFLEWETTPAPNSPSAAGYHHPGEPMHRWIHSRDSLVNAGILLKRRNMFSGSTAYVRGLFRASGGPVLIHGSGYNWDDALADLYREGWRPIHRMTGEMAGAPLPSSPFTQTVRDILDTHPRLQELKQFLSIDTSRFLSERISTIISDAAVESVESYRSTRSMIAEKGIRALLTSARDRAAGHAAVQAARDEGIPVISWQHGGSGYAFHPMMPCIECINTDLHLAFGTNAEEKYREAMEWLGWKDRPPVVAVGSSSLDWMRARLSGTRQRGNDGPVLYVTTLYLHNIFQISQPFHPIGRDERLWEFQRKVIDLAGQFPEREFIIKLHPTHRSREPIGSYILDSGRTNVRCITHESSLEDLLPRSSLILFDLVSTGILQAMLTAKPIFLYSGLYGLDQSALALLQKRVIVSHDPGDFIGNVTGYLEGRARTGPPPEYSQEFIRAYGLYEADGMSARRAVSLLARMVHDSPGSSLLEAVSDK